MLERGAALRGGMPLYKFVGNKILTAFQNRMLGTALSEFHSGYRVYSSTAPCGAFRSSSNTNDFHFDTEIIIQLLRAGQRILELPIPTYYGDELCHVNGLKYASDVASSVLVARVAEPGAVLRSPLRLRAGSDGSRALRAQAGYLSPHSLALEYVSAGSRVLDLGCAGGRVADLLTRSKGCHVTAVDRDHPMPDAAIEEFTLQDLDRGSSSAGVRAVRLRADARRAGAPRSPEEFVEKLRDCA